jgi:MFS family permease
MESVWYYAHDGAQTGPVSFGDLRAAVASGQLGAEDLVWKEGTVDWVPARSVAGLFPTTVPTIPPPPARPPAPARVPARGADSLPLADEATPAPPPVRVPGQGNEYVELAKEFLRRTAVSNPSQIGLTPDEDRVLTQSGYEPVTRKYVVWRRAVLWVAVVPTALAGLFALISLLDMETNEKALLGAFGTLVLFLQVFALCAMPIVAALAAMAYERPTRSMQIVLIGGLATLLVPVIFAFIPSSWLIAGPAVDGDSESVQLIKMSYSRELGAKFYMFLFPALFSVVMAASLACARVKGFLPESQAPGWAFVVSVPLLALVTLSTYLVVYHYYLSHILLLLGLLALIGAPLIYLTRFRILTRPLTESQDLQALARTQIYVFATLGAGVLLIFIYMVAVKVGDGAILGTSKKPKNALRFWSLDLHKAWLEYLGRTLFLTVMFADLLVRMAVMVWREDRAFAGTGPAANFDRTMSGFGEAVETKGLPPVT